MKSLPAWRIQIFRLPFLLLGVWALTRIADAGTRPEAAIWLGIGLFGAGRALAAGTKRGQPPAQSLPRARHALLTSCAGLILLGGGLLTLEVSRILEPLMRALGGAVLAIPMLVLPMRALYRRSPRGRARGSASVQKRSMLARLASPAPPEWVMDIVRFVLILVAAYTLARGIEAPEIAGRLRFLGLTLAALGHTFVLGAIRDLPLSQRPPVSFPHGTLQGGVLLAIGCIFRGTGMYIAPEHDPLTEAMRASGIGLIVAPFLIGGLGALLIFSGPGLRFRARLERRWAEIEAEHPARDRRKAGAAPHPGWLVLTSVTLSAAVAVQLMRFAFESDTALVRIGLSGQALVALGFGIGLTVLIWRRRTDRPPRHLPRRVLLGTLLVCAGATLMGISALLAVHGSAAPLEALGFGLMMVSAPAMLFVGVLGFAMLRRPAPGDSSRRGLGPWRFEALPPSAMPGADAAAPLNARTAPAPSST